MGVLWCFVVFYGIFLHGLLVFQGDYHAGGLVLCSRRAFVDPGVSPFSKLPCLSGLAALYGGSSFCGGPNALCMMLCAADESRWHLASARSKVTGVAKSAADEGDQKNDRGRAWSALSILSMLSMISCLTIRTQQKVRRNSRDSLLSLVI